MISRLLLLGFASGAPRDVFLCAQTLARPGQADQLVSLRLLCPDGADSPSDPP
jgi:hypothetical protein